MDWTLNPLWRPNLVWRPHTEEGLDHATEGYERLQFVVIRWGTSDWLGWRLYEIRPGSPHGREWIREHAGDESESWTPEQAMEWADQEMEKYIQRAVK